MKKASHRVFSTAIWSCLVLICATSCSKTSINDQNKSPWPNAVMYEIFVQSFADSNDDGIGDIQGMTAKLDYLNNLGIGGVWLMPINPSPSYHKYDVTNYYDIHPDYGTLDDFRKFISAAHERNIRVVMDLVVNHTSSDHPWFKAAQSDSTGEFRDYYVWANPDSIRDQIAKKKITLDSDNINQWHASRKSSKYYYGFFYGGMPDLNFDNPKVREEIIDIGKYWLKLGVDGFRLDAAKHIFPDERAVDTHAWWMEFGDAMRVANPEVYLVGEVWGDAKLIAPYLKGLPSMFNFDFYHGINEIMLSETNNGVIDSLVKTRTIYARLQPDYIDAIFLNNHDQNRLLSVINGNTEKAKVAATILLTVPGMPYIYYGDEIGMLGVKPDPEIREPFVWDYGTNAREQTTWITGKNSNDSTVVPLAAQIDDPGSLFTTYRELIGLRNQLLPLSHGNLESIAMDSSLVVYSRGYLGDTLITIINISDKTVQVQVPSDCLCEPLFVSSDNVYFNNATLTMPTMASTIIRK